MPKGYSLFKQYLGASGITIFGRQILKEPLYCHIPLLLGMECWIVWQVSPKPLLSHAYGRLLPFHTHNTCNCISTHANCWGFTLYYMPLWVCWEGSPIPFTKYCGRLSIIGVTLAAGSCWNLIHTKYCDQLLPSHPYCSHSDRLLPIHAYCRILVPWSDQLIKSLQKTSMHTKWHMLILCVCDTFLWSMAFSPW